MYKLDADVIDLEKMTKMKDIIEIQLRRLTVVEMPEVLNLVDLLCTVGSLELEPLVSTSTKNNLQMLDN